LVVGFFLFLFEGRVFFSGSLFERAQEAIFGVEKEGRDPLGDSQEDLANADEHLDEAFGKPEAESDVD
jgi:hypothetical protein